MRLKLPSDHKSAPILFLILALAAALFALSFRTTQVVGTDLFHPNLWGEDGAVFIDEAHRLGISSVVKPYAGYVHLIPRLAAYLTSFMPLEIAPLLYHLAWLSVFITFVCVVHSRLAAIGVPAVFHVWALVLLAIQPQAGEVFYTLTNIQWFAGLALLAYLIFPSSGRVRAWQIALVCAAGLTGPFSILATPVLALRALLFRDLRTKWPVYLAVVVCAVIQAGFIISSPTAMGGHAAAADVDTWLSALFRFLSFGNEYPLATVFAFVFWASMPWHRIIRAVVDRFKTGLVNERATGDACAFVMILTACGMMAVGFLRDDPETMGPVILSNGVASGSRYYLIPYSLFILAAVVSTFRDRSRAIAVLGALTVICIANFVRPERADYQWHAYSKFARVVPGLVIPIAPRIEADPGWSVNASSQYSGDTKSAQVVPVPLADVAVENGEIIAAGGKTVVRAKPGTDDFQITFPAGRCTGSETIGLEVAGHRSFGGWMQVLWASANSFNDKDSVLRYYSPGAFKGKFAFERTMDQDVVRVRLGFVPGGAEVDEIRMHCLG